MSLREYYQSQPMEKAWSGDAGAGRAAAWLGRKSPSGSVMVMAAALPVTVHRTPGAARLWMPSSSWLLSWNAGFVRVA